MKKKLQFNEGVEQEGAVAPRDGALGEAWRSGGTVDPGQGRRDTGSHGPREEQKRRVVRAERILTVLSEIMRPKDGLSEKLEQSTKKKRGEKNLKQFLIPRKTKSCPRKEINHSTLCALSESSVYIVVMLN